LLEEVLNYGSETLRAAITAAVVRGDITWDALPMNGESENSIGDPSLFIAGLDAVKRLDRRFNQSHKIGKSER
jgi:hypothetical protein